MLLIFVVEMQYLADRSSVCVEKAPLPQSTDLGVFCSSASSVPVLPPAPSTPMGIARVFATSRDVLSRIRDLCGRIPCVLYNGGDLKIVDTAAAGQGSEDERALRNSSAKPRERIAFHINVILRYFGEKFRRIDFNSMKSLRLDSTSDTQLS